MGLFDNAAGELAHAHSKFDTLIAHMANCEYYLAHLYAGARSRDERDTAVRLRDRAVCNAAGTVDITFTPTPGNAWELLNVAVSGNNGGAIIFVGPPDDPAMFTKALAIPAAGGGVAYGFNDEDFKNEYIPQGATVTVRFVGQANGQNVTAGLKLRRDQDQPIHEVTP